MGLSTPLPQPVAVSPTSFNPSPNPTSTPSIPDTGWQSIRTGLEQRTIRRFAEKGKQIEQLYLLRVDPTYYRFDIAYQPKNPLTLAEWQAETGALIILNGGYYRQEGETFIPTGLTIINGQPLGVSYADFAGMFTVTENGPQLRWLAQAPYNPAESIMAALQSFPLLVKPGGELGFSEQYEDGVKARRTVIGQDRAGRILLLVAAQGDFTLHQLSLYLSNSDLGLDIALNLDGGASSGLLLADSAQGVTALSRLPIVITVYPR